MPSQTSQFVKPQKRDIDQLNGRLMIKTHRNCNSRRGKLLGGFRCLLCPMCGAVALDSSCGRSRTTYLIFPESTQLTDDHGQEHGFRAVPLALALETKAARVPPGVHGRLPNLSPSPPPSLPGKPSDAGQIGGNGYEETCSIPEVIGEVWFGN
ncbi:hypothetical protein VC83_05649 [Pseudogymnoascus destructans]|uniref:Uncharacterized protein n=1 Tax=Pseudogymnoascus destructans TaxID=655981 RepID=A0A177A8V1_9PEZI|nr:uncharacterized protein VC83_05649 [Pseudogymnoascus destructans]OAF57842.2 hypothetical protein VC83_05649 [Pseudogymnoascus destructans]